MNKKKEYLELVKLRKKFDFKYGLENPSNTEFDINEIEPWAQWQNNLNADIMVIGQEFCDLKTYNQCKGKVEIHKDKFEYPSNKNLREYLKMIGYDPGHPLNPNKSTKLFFTNCVMGLKDGTMSANFSDRWINESRTNFLEPLIKIINPKMIICIGTKATLSVSRIFKFSYKSLKKLTKESPIEKSEKIIFPVYHTGGLGIRNQSRENQKNDWQKIKNWMENNHF